MNDLSPEHTEADTYTRLLHKITSRQILPGERLPEVALAEELQVSRTPIREALRQLAAEGYVDLHKNRGATVAEFEDDLRELFELRILLEGHAAGLAAQRASAEQVAELRAIHARFERAIVDTSEEARHEAARINLEFHRAIHLAAGNKRLEMFVSSVTSASLIDSTFELYSIDQLHRSASQHQQLLDAIVHGDRGLAEMAMRVHISGAQYLFKRDS
jgi:DNA-binding GntR family transcriptional regulator